MRILLVGDYLPDEIQSIRRFAEVLARELTARGHDVTLARARPCFGRPKSTSAGWKRHLARLGYIDKYVLFPLHLRCAAAGFDVVHFCTHEDTVPALFLSGIATVATCHDLIYLRVLGGEIKEERPRLIARLRNGFVMWALKRVDKIVCVSEATRQDVLRLAAIEPSRVSVVYNGLNYPYAPMASDEACRRLTRLGLPSEMFFYMHVGNQEFYKNRTGLVQIFAALARIFGFTEARLVMVGKPFTAALESVIVAEGLADRVAYVGSVDNEDLRALYSRSAGLIFPSLYEGFGWPPLEAMACGCPVFASNRPPMTEVGGDAARYFDPGHPAEAAALIASAAPERALMAEAGLARARRFTTEAMIEGYLAAYRAAIREARGCDPLT